MWPCVCPALILSFGCPVLLLHPHSPVHLQQTQRSEDSAFLCVAQRTSLKGWPYLQNPICSITCISSALETVFSLVPSLPLPHLLPLLLFPPSLFHSFSCDHVWLCLGLGVEPFARHWLLDAVSNDAGLRLGFPSLDAALSFSFFFIEI